jgi:hypothetical protein
MTLLHRVIGWFAPDNHQVEAARARLTVDQMRVEKSAKRLESSADALEKRVDTNHISASVADLIRRARQ